MVSQYTTVNDNVPYPLHEVSQYITDKLYVHTLHYVIMVLLQDTHRNMCRNIK